MWQKSGVFDSLHAVQLADSGGIHLLEVAEGRVEMRQTLKAGRIGDLRDIAVTVNQQTSGLAHPHLIDKLRDRSPSAPSEKF